MFSLRRWTMLAAILVTTPADAESPASPAAAWTGNARLAAGQGHCDAVNVLSDKVRATDPAYHATVFAVDSTIATCLGPAREAPATIDSRTAPHRIGVDGFASMGIIATAGGSVRYERRFESSSLTVRLGGLSGVAIEGEDDGFDAALAQIGYRSYWGRSYLAIEAGGTAIRQRAFYDSIDDDPVGAKWTGFPSGSLTVGAKLAGQVDIGISGLFPFLGVGLHLGLDFKHW